MDCCVETSAAPTSPITATTLQGRPTAIAGGRADLVSFGKAFHANPDLVARFRAAARAQRPRQVDLPRRQRKRLYRLPIFGVGVLVSGHPARVLCRSDLRCLLLHELPAMTPILIIPGLNGSGPHHWQTHFEQSFPDARRVHQGDWRRPNRGAWAERLIAAIEATPGCVLVAHSLGCILVAHVAVDHPDLAVKAALLVAPADVESPRRTPEQIRGFAPIPRTPLPFRSVVVASTNDPYMALPRAHELANAWGAEFFDAGPVGHINVDGGFGPWSIGERILRGLMTAPCELRSLLAHHCTLHCQDHET